MHNHTQKPSVSNAYQDQQSTRHAISSNPLAKKQKLHSVFNLVKLIKGKQAVICTALTGEQASGLVTALGNELNSPLLIKFTGMEVAK